MLKILLVRSRLVTVLILSMAYWAVGGLLCVLMGLVLVPLLLVLVLLVRESDTADWWVCPPHRTPDAVQ